MNKFEKWRYDEAVERYDQLPYFLKNKINYLESKEHLTENTKNAIWISFKKEIYPFEYAWDKDLALFNEKDVEKILISVAGSTIVPAKTLRSVMNRYEIWALQTGLNPAANPVEGIVLSNIVKPVKTMMENTVISIDELFDLWNYIQTAPNEFCDRLTYQNFAMILLIRIGLKGIKEWNEVKYIKKEDIDFDKGIIYVTNRDKEVEEDKKPLEIVKEIYVEDRILEVIKKAMKEEGYSYSYETGKNNALMQIDNIYVDYGHIIKPEEEQGEIINSTLFRKRVENFFKASERNYINAKDIFRNAKMDMLFNIKEKNGEVSIEDIKNINDYFEPYLTGNTTYTPLREFYAAYTGDNITGAKIITGEKISIEEYRRRYYQNVTKPKREREKLSNDSEEFNLLKGFRGEKREKEECYIYNKGKKEYPRDPRVVANARNIANYKCEIDMDHPSFIRKKDNKKYTEAHHLIPLRYHEEFEYSLDVEENVISLCSNCHRCLHHGIDTERSRLLEKLYKERNKLLKKVGLDISLEQLKEYYKIYN